MASTRQTFGDRMAVLKNARHERFAQEVASGKTQEEAYRAAGYKPSRSDASKLHANPNISARVATLLANSASRVEIDVGTVTDNLLRIALAAELKDTETGLGVARNAWMDVAKLAGLITEKVQREDVGKLAPRPNIEDALASLRVIGEANGVTIQ